MKGDWQADKTVARAILHDRSLRRKALTVSLLLALGLLVTGLWVIADWLEQGIIRFLLWWGACASVTLWVMLFALYDALRSIQEEKEKNRNS